MTKTLSASDIVAGLNKRYAAPEWAIFFNVANGTGVRTYRYADAIAMCLFPSRGLEIHGFEVKVSKSDWKREAADPQKAETIAAYCDRWWVVTPPKLLENELIPPNWGWMTYDGRAFYTQQKAEKTEAKALDRTFLAALLRRAHESNAALVAGQVEEKASSVEDTIKERVDRGVAERSREYQRLVVAVGEFEKASGVNIQHQWSLGDIGKAVAIVQACGIGSFGRSVPSLIESLRKSADTIDKALIESGLSATREAAE
jgi:hypothetical protein